MKSRLLNPFYFLAAYFALPFCYAMYMYSHYDVLSGERRAIIAEILRWVGLSLLSVGATIGIVKSIMQRPASPLTVAGTILCIIAFVYKWLS